MEIIATASHLPSKVVTNFDLEKLVDTSDEWIQKRTGIVQRHIATDETTSSMATIVAEKLIKQAKINVEDIRLIIVATMSPDYTTPSTASIVQGNLAATNAVSFDIAAACSGFVYALSTAEKMARTYANGYVLVIGSEKMSRIIDWQDRTTCVLFGDGAGGVLIDTQASQEDSFLLSEDLRSDGKRGQAIVAGGYPETDIFLSEQEKQTRADMAATDGTARNQHYMTMAGREVYDFATRTLPKHIQSTLEKASLSVDALDYVVLHQANLRILDVIARKLKIDRNKVSQNIAEVANTSAASIPILIDDMVIKGDLRLDGSQKISLSGFGGGLTWGTLIIKI